ncbi:hypothetical protein BBJ28_00009330 [Nothophytophthora sp. Chile5]|nr:hypothetical protein BBJ28_00009330 [Nothophytophthora sp. Chile5]
MAATDTPVPTTSAVIEETEAPTPSPSPAEMTAMVTPSPASTSSGSNATTPEATSTSGSGGSGEGVSPGHVHASSSAAESSKDSAKTSRSGSSASESDGDKRTHKQSTTSSTSETGTASSSGSSKPGSDGIAALVNPGGVSDVNTSSATYYSLGTASIVAIVGVVAGIMGILVLFVVISRKKYTSEDNDSPLPYGYNMDNHSIVRLSPTFLQDDSFLQAGYNNNMELVASSVHPNQHDAASSSTGESCNEVPSFRGHAIVSSRSDPMEDISLRSRVPTVQSFSGDLDSSAVRGASTLYSASSLASASDISGSWSSVLASDCDLRQPSRNTRDTSLSAWTSAHLSSFGSNCSGASSLYRATGTSATSTEFRGTTGCASDQPPTRGSVDSRRSSSYLMFQPDPDAELPDTIRSQDSSKSTEV